MRLSDVIALLLLGAIWGSSFLFMRMATPEFGPVALNVLRVGIAALCLMPMLVLGNRFTVVRHHWRHIALVGIFNTAIPFTLFSYATVSLGAGVGSVINATAPMFGALLAFLWLKERISALAVVGLIVGFAGTFVLAIANASATHTDIALLPLFAGLLATFCYGLSVCYIKKYLQGVDAMSIAIGSCFFATLAILPFALISWPQVAPSINAWWRVFALGALCTGVAYILYFRLIANVGVSKAITVAYLIPVFGILWGLLFADEILSLAMLVGVAMVLLGVSLTTGLFKAKNVS